MDERNPNDAPARKFGIVRGETSDAVAEQPQASVRFRYLDDAVSRCN